MDVSGLRPFRGLHTSLICFSSGHVFRISHWADTPTEYGACSNLWMVTPDGRRVLFADPRPSARVVCIYHDFDEVHGAHISIERNGQRDLRFSMEADEGTRIEMDLRLKATLATRLLILPSRGLPASWSTTDPAIRFAEGLTSALVTKGRTKISGETDTGQPFFNGEFEQLLLVEDGSAQLNGALLGRVAPPKHPVAFGDCETTPRSLVIVGALYLSYEKPGQQRSAGG